VLIDDAPQAKGDCLEPGWEHIYFDQPYNRPADGGASGAGGGQAGLRRLVAWKDWRSLTPLVTREHV
jgi:hypothetical protein|tara:strand:- start:435 stop:635 length:201 start_codon:yes stop_codon:yes gene_type:complete